MASQLRDTRFPKLSSHTRSCGFSQCPESLSNCLEVCVMVSALPSGEMGLNRGVRTRPPWVLLNPLRAPPFSGQTSPNPYIGQDLPALRHDVRGRIGATRTAPGHPPRDDGPPQRLQPLSENTEVVRIALTGYRYELHWMQGLQYLFRKERA